MSTVRTDDDAGVRLLTLDRPDALNAFNAALFDDLTDAVLAATGDDTVRVLVLTGAGRAFSAGADLKRMGEPSTGARHGLNGLLEALIDFPKPILLAINGLGVGIGATIVGLVDVAVIADDARLRAPFSALGLTAEAASTSTFPRLMGHQRACWFLMSGEWLTAEQCVDAGLAIESCPTGEVLTRTMERARALAALPLDSLTATKDLIVGPQRPLRKAAVAAENEALAGLLGGPANREAIAAFREKRPVDFTALDRAETGGDG